MAAVPTATEDWRIFRASASMTAMDTKAPRSRSGLVVAHHHYGDASRRRSVMTRVSAASR